jgi:hypothetical protein
VATRESNPVVCSVGEAEIRFEGQKIVLWFGLGSKHPQPEKPSRFHCAIYATKPSLSPLISTLFPPLTYHNTKRTVVPLPTLHRHCNDRQAPSRYAARLRSRPEREGKSLFLTTRCILTKCGANRSTSNPALLASCASWTVQ